MKNHKLTLMGGSAGALRVSAASLQETLSALIEGARQAARFRVEGESVRKGPRPAWLESVCAIDVTGLTAGSAVIALEAPTLAEADAARFGGGDQRSLFEEPGRSLGAQTAVDLFADVLAAVVEGDPDAVLADRALLDSCVRLARVAGRDFDGVRLDGLTDRESPVVITPDQIPMFELLRDETPPPQAIRVTGTLDTISASRADVVLALADGTKVAARLEDHDSALLGELFGTQVVVSGVARYRPSGRPLPVQVESLEAAREADRVFGALPPARGSEPAASSVRQNETSGVSAFFGTWPGTETDDELLAALRAIG